MAKPFVPITLVRWTGQDAAAQLQGFVFGGLFAGNRPPRGIDPEFVSYWILENITASTGAMPISNLLNLLRFYERADVLPHLARTLTRQEPDGRALTRSLYIAQCLGELGNAEVCSFASSYYAELLLPHPAAIDNFPLILETADSLAATVDLPAVGRRLQAAIDTAAKVPDRKGPAGAPYRQLTGYARNNLLSIQRTVEAKRRLMAAEPAQRLQELIFIYLGQSPLSLPSMEIFAARLIRGFAMNEDQETVNKAFSQVIEGTAKSQFDKPRKNFVIHRAAQAIIYFQGKLTFPQEALYEAIQSGPANFLWDDLGPPK